VTAGTSSGDLESTRIPVLRGERVALRPLQERDVPALAAILAEPEVARWWGRWDEARVRAELLGDDDDIVLAVEVDKEVAGVLQWYEEPDPEYRHAALDVSLRTADQGRGLGPEALRLAIGYLIHERGHHRLTIDPAAANRRAIRAYAAVGFKPVGVMRRYERGPDGEWRDGLLMDLVADEFVAL
jgi:aminoglycoside 6'-N-acetyltransferase